MKSVNSQLKYAYFLGAGGIGMSALLRYFLSKGVEVHGYDRGPSKLTRELEKEGANLHYRDDPKLIPAHFLSAREEEVLWVYTPAIPKSHAEFSFLLKNGFILLKRSEVLGRITANSYNIAIAGTHGKTTTTCMLASVMSRMDLEQHAFMGGISSDLGSNYFYREGRGKEISICEADEFDRSFLQLSPDRAVITSMDADHLDIYAERHKVEEAYLAFAARLDASGTLYCQVALGDVLKTINKRTVTYGIDQGEARITNLRAESRASVFDFSDGNDSLKDIRLGIPGRHNAENACVAIKIARDMGCEESVIRDALTDFKGIKRRFEIILHSDRHVYIDDYAHHPTEIRAVLESVRLIYPGKKLTVLFQPHLFSRTRDFHMEFARALEIADDIYLMDIYPAREEPIAGVSSHLIITAMQKQARMLSRDNIAQKIRELNPELMVSLGAGDIDLEVETIKRALLKNE